MKLATKWVKNLQGKQYSYFLRRSIFKCFKAALQKYLHKHQVICKEKQLKVSNKQTFVEVVFQK